MDLVFATDASEPDCSQDDRLLLGEFRRRGLAAACVAWRELGEAPVPRLCVLRARAAAREHPGELASWVAATAARARVLNPPEALLWNLGPAHSKDLDARGVTWRRRGAVAVATAVVFVGGRFSHAVRPAAAGARALAEPSTAELLVAQHALEAARQHAAFARIDVGCDGRGEIAVAAVDLVAPELYLALRPDLAARAADAIETALSGRSAP